MTLVVTRDRDDRRAASPIVSQEPSTAARRTIGPPPIPWRSPVGDRAPDLLLEREEEAGREHEDEDPERVEGRVVGLAQGAERQDLEEVRRDARDEQTGADDEGALGEGAAGGFDQPLGALGHGWVSRRLVHLRHRRAIGRSEARKA